MLYDFLLYLALSIKIIIKKKKLLKSRYILALKACNEAISLNGV